jgi:hypothetical protein
MQKKIVACRGVARQGEDRFFSGLSWHRHSHLGPDTLCREPCAVGLSLIKCQYFTDPFFLIFLPADPALIVFELNWVSLAGKKHVNRAAIK